MWKVLLIVFVAGALGGLLNAFMSGSGVILPQLTVVDGSRVLLPGFTGNVLVGAVAALISFGLYGPFSSMSVLGPAPPGAGAPGASAQLTLAALAGAALVGYSGSRWITAEADKQLNHGTAVAATQIAEHLAAVDEASTEAASRSAGSPSVGPAEVQSLARSVRTRSPREAYQEALKLSEAVR